MMKKVSTPEDVLPDGDDHTLAVNPFTGFQGKARKGTVAATLNNIAMLNKLLLENSEQNQIAEIKKAVIGLIPSLKAVGIFDFFTPAEWIGSLCHPGRVYVALLYLQRYPEEITKEIAHQLRDLHKKTQNAYLQSELQSLCK